MLKELGEGSREEHQKVLDIFKQKPIQLPAWDPMFAEGNRLFDMKRWKIGMKRSSSDAQRDDYLPALGTDIEKEATDNRWVWPIPKDEMDSNPQLKGQQNPGY